MLTHIDIRNFQKHKTISIPIREDVTVIMGPSDEGKSAIIRAMEWVGLNDTPDADFIRWGADFVRATLTIDDQKVTRYRKRAAGTNIYKINGKRYAAVRTSVPEPVSMALKLGSVNFQSQLDSAFWLSDTPGNVSKHLNQVVDLEQMDLALGRVSQRLRRVKTEESLHRARVCSLKSDKKKLRWILDADRKWKAVEHLKLQVDSSSQMIDTLSRMIQDGESQSYQAKKLVKITKSLRILISAGSKAIDEKNRIDSLGALISGLTGLEAKITGSKPDVSKLMKSMKTLIEAKNSVNSLENLVQDLEAKGSEEWRLRKQIERTNQELNQMARICSKCGNLVLRKNTK